MMPCHITDGWPRTPEDLATGGYQCVVCYDNTATEDEEVCPACKAKIEAEPHASDCAVWVNEPCSCAMRFDPDYLADRAKDREVGL